MTKRKVVMPLSLPLPLCKSLHRVARIAGVEPSTVVSVILALHLDETAKTEQRDAP